MAEIVFTTTPDILEGYLGDLRTSSQMLRREVKRISSILASVNSSVEGPGLTGAIQNMKEKTDRLADYTDDLDGLSAYILNLAGIYHEAQSRYVDSLKNRMKADLTV